MLIAFINILAETMSFHHTYRYMCRELHKVFREYTQKRWTGQDMISS